MTRHKNNVILKLAKHYLDESIKSTDTTSIQSFRLKSIESYKRLLEPIDITDYLLIDSDNPLLPKSIFLHSYFILGTLYKLYIETLLSNDIINLRLHSSNRSSNAGSNGLLQSHLDIFRKSINCFLVILRVDFDNKDALQQLVSVFTHLCFLSQSDLNSCLKYLQECLFYTPSNSTIHYNLGLVYHKLNKLELSIIHYKLSLSLLSESVESTSESTTELFKLKLNVYNGIASIYRSLKQWPEALFYLLKAHSLSPTDPDINNQLGVVYTEMRRTDLADSSYCTALSNVYSCVISTDPRFLESEILLNYGHMHSYNGNNQTAIEFYNKSLHINPSFSLPFQNKLMNLCYVFNQLDDKFYISNQHKHINKLFINNKKDVSFAFPPSFWNTPKINIGIVSADLVDHPVSFFISTFLEKFDSSRFSVTCYSECIVDKSLFNPSLNFKFIKNLSSSVVANLVFSDNIHILFDLSGHTALNRLDVFALKPSPIQISYIGYPFTTGLLQMDYRITDSICDNVDISQPFYSEKLLFLDNCFLCYNPKLEILPTLSVQPFLQSRTLRIGCFNRLNKISDSLISLVNSILLKFPNIHFYFKTKALLNTLVKNNFISKFSKSVVSQITILPCTILHNSHLLEYNKLDLALDTFPYSGTTTSCESLLMGVPVLTLYDSKYFFHPQNVTSSILSNSDLKSYIFNDTPHLENILQDLLLKNDTFWSNLKSDTRSKFLSGKTCNQTLFIQNFTTLLSSLFQKHRLSTLSN